MQALLKLRRLQLDTIRRSQGAFVRIEPNAEPPLLDLARIGRESPLTPDFHSLLVLQLIADFPERGNALRAILLARRTGMNIGELVEALWHEDGADLFQRVALRHLLDPHLLAGTLWVALKPLYESVAAAFVRHFDLPAGRDDCPVCGGPPWARLGDSVRCAVCETEWGMGFGGRNFVSADGPHARGAVRVYDTNSGMRLMELDETLFEHAFDPAPMIDLLRLLG